MRQHGSGRAAALRVLPLVTFALAIAACGSSGSSDNPERPIIAVEVDSQLVDVGGQYRLDASGSFDPTGRGLDFFWTLLPPTGSTAEIDDYCEEVEDQICDENFDACLENISMLCTSNADCDQECLENAAATSPDCSEGPCGVGEGPTQSFITFTADLAGPYTTRVLVETDQANDIEDVDLDTYPSLFVLGSMFSFGGTEGAALGDLPDVETFASGATAAVANPSDGNLLLAIRSPGRIREFDFRSGEDLGIFGETNDFVDTPVAMTFDGSGRLFVADDDGTVRIFDSIGRFINVFGDVTGAGEGVVALAFSPESGDLLVADGAAGMGIRGYDPVTAAPAGVLGQTATAVGQAVDLVFYGDPATDLFIADAAGDLVRCDPDGTGCAGFGNAAALLAAGGPTAVAVNPAADVTSADVLVADALGEQVVGCDVDTVSCTLFGDTDGLDSDYRDIVFAPPVVPEVAPPPMIPTTTTSMAGSTTTSSTTTVTTP